MTAKDTAVNDNTPTALAVEQTGHLQKTLRRFDIIFLIIAAVVSVEALGQVSTFGAETFTWALVLAVVFLVPYGLIFAEIGSTFTDEGGVYVWVRRAFGRPLAAVASLFTWVTQPVWVGGAMAFLAVRHLERAHPPDRSRVGRRLRLQDRVHLDHRERRDRQPQAG